MERDVVTRGSLPLLGPDPNAPKDLRLVGRYAVGVDWQDNHHSIYPFAFLRESCACASCSVTEPACGPSQAAGESPWPTEIKKEGTGLRIRWQDGHESTFSGRRLREICRCAACTGGH